MYRLFAWTRPFFFSSTLPFHPSLCVCIRVSTFVGVSVNVCVRVCVSRWVQKSGPVKRTLSVRIHASVLWDAGALFCFVFLSLLLLFFAECRWLLLLWCEAVGYGRTSRSSQRDAASFSPLLLHLSFLLSGYWHTHTHIRAHTHVRTRVHTNVKAIVGSVYYCIQSILVHLSLSLLTFFFFFFHVFVFCIAAAIIVVGSSCCCCRCERLVRCEDEQIFLCHVGGEGAWAFSCKSVFFCVCVHVSYDVVHASG